MKRIANVSVYDALELVQISTRVRVYDDYDQDTGWPDLHLCTEIRSEGIDNSREWLRDALVALLEVL